MTILHMDIESVQNTRQNLVAVQQIIREDVISLSLMIQRIIGTAWIGPSAQSFYEEYDLIKIRLLQKADALDQLSKTLQNEIGQWQDVAARFDKRDISHGNRLDIPKTVKYIYNVIPREPFKSRTKRFICQHLLNPLTTTTTKYIDDRSTSCLMIGSMLLGQLITKNLVLQGDKSSHPMIPMKHGSWLSVANLLPFPEEEKKHGGA